MKRFSKSILGVTLLEIMLVLAIAAMIIVMSVRYYQTASASQQANSVLQSIQAITSIADGLAQGSGSYTVVSQNSVKALMPNKIMTTPWGTTIAVSTGTATSYDVTFPTMPAAVCAQVTPKLQGNANYNITSSCGSSATDFKYTYKSGV